MSEIPYKIYLEEKEMPTAWYNVRADMKNKPAPLINPGTLQPMGFEELLRRLFTDYGLAMNFEQYALVGSTVRSYLAWLKDAGRVTVRFEDNRMLWESV